MAGIVMCDRCENFGKVDALGGVIVQRIIANRGENSRTMELCPTCIGDLIKFIDSRPGRGDRPPFTEPYEPDDTEPPAITA